MSELKPCPFCGGEAIICEEETCFPNPRKTVQCISCYANNNWYKSEQEAIATWNRRAQPANEPLTNTGGSFNGTGNVYNGTGPCGNICVGTGRGDSDANV